MVETASKGQAVLIAAHRLFRRVKLALRFISVLNYRPLKNPLFPAMGCSSNPPHHMGIS